MRLDTKRREKAIRGFDAFARELGVMMVEAVRHIEREELSGSDYQPFSSEVQKWASEAGLVYIGDHKVRVQRPRLRGPQG